MATSDELRRLLAEGTPGPWADEDNEIVNRECEDNGLWCVAEVYDPRNTALILELHSQAPALLDATDERDRLLAENAKLRACADSRHLDIVEAAGAVEAENVRLREALKPFEHECREGPDKPAGGETYHDADTWHGEITVGDLRRAAAALGDKS